MYVYSITDCIKEYIDNELENSKYYIELSKLAPTAFVREMLLGLSHDEKCHAGNLKQAYYYITNRIYTSKPLATPAIPGYEEGLKNRMLSETEDYRKYGMHYIEVQNKYLKNLFFAIKTSEARHAMQVSLLFDECKCYM